MRRAVAVIAIAVSLVCGTALADHKPLSTGAFEVTHAVILSGTPEEVFDAVTVDIGNWWDHTFSKNPVKLYIEPKPGGGFWEIFDEDGNGVLHATVTAADRGKLLRFVGPLGLAGNAIDMVHTYEITALADHRTQLRVTVRAYGHVQEGWSESVDEAWRHFLVERLQRYMELGTPLRRSPGFR
jgi:uncharacterized protein YndB with AHSA1/START domain